jgi:ribosome assembly protein RRB1
MDVDGVIPAAEDGDGAPAPADVFLPGSRALAADEVLEADDSVYTMRHALGVRWPCLSFDVLRDALGDGRQTYPATAYIVAGTQADAAKNNELAVYKLSALHRTQRDPGAFACHDAHLDD